MERKIYYLSGSFTVEAAFLMPILLFIIFALIYNTLYLCDRVEIEKQVHENLYFGSEILKHKTDMKTGNILYEKLCDGETLIPDTSIVNNVMAQLTKRMKAGLNNKLILGNKQMVQLKGGYSNIQVSVQINEKTPLYGIIKFYNKNKGIIEIDETANIYNPADFVRKWNRRDIP